MKKKLSGETIQQLNWFDDIHSTSKDIMSGEKNIGIIEGDKAMFESIQCDI